jgi:thiamine phosphate synthase YjbQ (UPF0047 family)
MYAHDARWGDGNGFSHVRSALLKTSLSVPVVDGELVLGTWQQVVAINLEGMQGQVTVVVGSGLKLRPRFSVWVPVPEKYLNSVDL